MWLVRLNVNLLKIDKIRNAVPQPHWSHFKCAIASCGWRQPYWTTKIQNFASLQKGLLDSSAQNDGWKQTYEGTLPWSFRTPGTKRRSQNACRESEGIKIRFAYKESEIRRALIFSTVTLKTSLYVFRFTEKILAHLGVYAQITHQVWGWSRDIVRHAHS